MIEQGVAGWSTWGKGVVCQGGREWSARGMRGSTRGVGSVQLGNGVGVGVVEWEGG